MSELLPSTTIIKYMWYSVLFSKSLFHKILSNIHFMKIEENNYQLFPNLKFPQESMEQIKWLTFDGHQIINCWIFLILLVITNISTGIIHLLYHASIYQGILITMKEFTFITLQPITIFILVVSQVMHINLACIRHS